MAAPRRDIAIIGSGCRFPGCANTPSDLWGLLRSPRQLAQPIPPDRFSGLGYYHVNGQYHGHFNVKEAYFLAEEGAHRRFDASFFGMSPAEATSLDPQCRLLLETVYDALQDAGLPLESLRGSNTAMYTGQMVADYDQLLMRDSDGSLGIYHASGTSHAILSNRISYFFDWHGPSMTIDTACSSSLVAVHQAVQQLRTGNSRVAIAAGSNLIMDPKCFISLSSLNMLSPDGRSKMWDAGANGYARGEGVAAIVLKTLEDALEDGDDIECVIRDTWFAQDGRTQGITSPNPVAQTQMIRDCYSSAGLDPTSPLGRPQFFECHGTGTGAGDAAEAEAIANSFFPLASQGPDAEPATAAPLYVGSVKSIIGHTEGTAGVAGVLKAALALRNSTIPANLLFNELNPRIRPFYHNVEVAATTTPWPPTPAGVPRRASVNSFGFGGANVHAILESYAGPSSMKTVQASPTPVYAPFVFSASSPTSLSRYLASFRDYLLDNRGSVPMRDLAFTLHTRRSCLNTAIAISASDEDELYNKITAKLYAQQRDGHHGFISRSASRPDQAPGKPSILGIFTGQGAQWAAMGWDLISTSKPARQVLNRMENRLARLPEADRPTWSLIEELQKGPESSRIGEATFSQPLCTAIQVLQVEMLRASGVVFSAVVGHSSGEIAAAYAAGFLTAEDAICIAYYRGHHAHLASGLNGKAGAMLAAGTSAEDAQELCDDPDFKGRAYVAAVNSSVSVTLSGDQDRIKKLDVILKDERKFARMLKVDKAYHSHHMESCSTAYLSSLAELDLRIAAGDQCAWFSSVLAGETMSQCNDSIKDSYWNSNMVKPVLFHQAVVGAVSRIGQPDLVVEIGPHPALKAPVLQTIQDLHPGKETLYTGLFKRGAAAIESVAEGMGYIWMHLGSTAVDLGSYATFLSGQTSHRLVKGLPAYSWEHRDFWHESRYAQAIRLRPGPVHELLGHMTPDSQEQDMRWRHILSPKEITWLLGHRIQGQVVFPGAGYVITALEASIAVCSQLGLSAALIELSDLQFGRALLFDTDESSVEIIISVSDIKRRGSERLEADFSYHAADGKGEACLNLIATASLDIVLGQPSPAALPTRAARDPNLTKIRIEDFYEASREIGYQWGGPFVALGNVERKLGSTRGDLKSVELTSLLVHPATLDAAFQAVLLAYSYPDDGQLWTVHVPRKIRRVTFNPFLCERQAREGSSSALPFSACHHPDTRDMIGNVDVYTSDSNMPNAMIQVEDLECVPFTRATNQDDKEAFATVTWDLAFPDIGVARARVHPHHGDQEEWNSCDRKTPYDPPYECLAQVIKQIVHRSPKLHILQVGGQETQLSQTIISEIGNSFSSYTVTSGESEEARTIVPNEQILYKVLDISQNPSEQGFTAAAYDVVILDDAVGPDSDVLRLLRNIRTLIKSGGFLLANSSQTYQQGDLAVPTFGNKVDTAFDAALRDAGFSGFDSHASLTSGPENGAQSCLLVSQAIDAKTSFLRSPMSSEYWPSLPSEPLIKHLVIVGGDTSGTKSLADNIGGLLRQFCRDVTAINLLTDLSSEVLSLESTVLCLAELDRPVFEDLKPAQWECIKKLAMEAGSMLWVTRGRRSDVPLSNIIVGLMRSITREIFTLSHQILDFECVSGIQAHTIAGALLKFRAETIWRQHDSSRAPVETELVVDENERLLIPRLKIDDEMNARYNALKRSITRNCKLRDNCVEVVRGTSNSGYELRTVPMEMQDMASKQQIRATHSLLSAIRVTEFCSLIPILGKHKVSGRSTFALSEKHTSIVDIEQGLFTEIEIPSGAETTFLSLAVFHILARAIFGGLCSGDVVLVNEPTMAQSEVLIKTAESIGVSISFVTSSMSISGCSSTGNWITMHPAATERSILRVLPDCVSVFVDLSPTERSQSRNRLDCLLSEHCRKEDLSTLFRGTSQMPRGSQLHEVKACIANCATQALTMLAGPLADAKLPTVAASSLANAGTDQRPLAVLDWTSEAEIACQLEPIDTQVRFSSQKTYWLVGLSRGLGLALCEWMTRRGARYFVISSRKPVIDAAWLDQMHALGCIIQVRPCDVTVKQQVDSVFQDICKTMPPIAGVAQGSMVLEDKAIREMTHESFLRGTAPKVSGSIHLNDCFPNNTLDFFVFFSSVVGVIGRPGQSNYSSGNCFMASLAEQRRRRGLAGSVIHIGPIYGIGYASRLERAIYSRANFRSTALVPTSERDFYQLFAEAVIAGRPSSSRHSIEIVNGVKRVGPYDKDRPVWEAEPLMSHFVRNRDEDSFNTDENVSKLPLKAQLAEASDREQVTTIIREAFLPKMCSIFQLDATETTQDELLSMRLDEIGIDSLLAVDIRSWFMKSLEVNIPVLKILSGVAIRDLINMASETLPTRLLPKLDTNSGTALQTGLDGLDNDSDSHNDLDTVPTSEATPISSSTRSEALGDTISLESDEVKVVGSPAAGLTSSAIDLRRTHELSFGQEMFWFVWAFIDDKTSLNHVAWAKIKGQLNIGDFQRAVDLMPQKHEILRTAIIEDEGRLVQSILNDPAWKLEVRQIETVDDVNAAVKKLQSQHVYDVSRGRTVRAMLLSTSPDEHFFVAGLHPLVADGMSFQSLIAGVQKLYSNPHERYAVRQFADFSDAQHVAMRRGVMRDELAFWKAEFQTLPMPLPILTVSRCVSRPPLTTYENVLATFRVSPETKRKVQALCRRYRVTPFHFYLATFRVLLLRFAPSADGEDVCIGVGDANRTDNSMMDIIGPLVNLLPLRLRTEGSVAFHELLQQTRDKTYKALAHSKLPFQALLKELDIPRSSSYTSLFQSFVNYRQGLRRTTRWGSNGDLALHSLEICIPKVPYDITLEMVDYVDGDCVQTLVLRKDIYDKHHATTLADSYKRLLQSFVTDPTTSLDQPDLFPPDEINQAMALSQGKTWQRKWPETLVHRVDDIGRSLANQIAVVHVNEVNTYADICAHANAVANSLFKADIHVQSPVAVLMERGPAWVSSLLGILRVGAVYVPLDLSLPSPRLRAIANNCRPKAVLVDIESAHHFTALDLPGVEMINVSTIDQRVPETTILASADQSAAILYTSGTSGTPKGIVLNHEGMLNWFEPIQSLYDLQAGSEVILQQTSSSFDMSLTQVFTALCLGGTLHITSREQRGDSEAICNIIQEQNVSYTCATPSEYSSWLRYGAQSLRCAKSWKTALCAGEALSQTLVDQFSALGNEELRLFNLYGPTEISITCTATPVPLDTSALPVTVGRPLPNYSIYILDGQLRPLARGIQGEVYVGGAGVASGYLNNTELTLTRFVNDCFASSQFKERGWTKLHRTGDLGRWQQDGTLVIEGRIDTQVKLRGLRIDLAEIEEALVTYSEGKILQAIVSMQKPNPDKSECLIARAVFANPNEADQQAREITATLHSVLPHYMCPAAILPIATMPTTASGKLDRKFVTSMDLPSASENERDSQSDREGTDDETRLRLRRVWEQVLDTKVGITDDTDFFYIGGSSLLLLDLQKRIKDTFGTTMSLIRMFELSTFGSMTQQIKHGLHHHLDSESVDWEAEIALSAPLLEGGDVLSETPDMSIIDSGVVVLTGVTGRLGKAIAERLAKDFRVKQIHCIGVRDPDMNTNSKLWGLDESKVVLHQGDLSLPNLGLSDAAAAEVFSDASLVIHPGADKSYLKSYRSLRAANLQSTKSLAELCLRYRCRKYVPIHYISTLAVRNMAFPAGVNGQSELEPHVGSVSQFQPPRLPQNVGISQTAYGYTASKWASEAFLERIHQQHPEWPIVIHRPCAMARDQDMTSNTPSSVLIESILHYSTVLHALPAVPVFGDRVKLVEKFDVVTVSEVASKVVLEAVEAESSVDGSESCSRKQTLRFVHHGSTSDDPRDRINLLKDVENGGSIQELPLNQWIRRACEAGMQPMMGLLLEDLVAAETHWASAG